SARARAEVPHHLIDIIEPHEQLSVAAFRRLARGVIDDVIARGATPLLVGGSGLYFRAVVDPLAFPPTDPTVRERLERQWANDPAAAHAFLAAHDPVAAERIDPGNLRRTVRALEVIELTGGTFSGFDEGLDRYVSVYADLRVGYLEPEPPTLRARIERRAAAMVERGLLDEARALRAAGPLSRTARQAIGYAEAYAVLDGELAGSELASTIARRTWRFAKRQRSWFRADARCVPETAQEVVERFYEA
ncbi:MAG: tRNA (adenosine(37)-N6)-dimethylallyltransferase MiaA, partial [Nitriliruptoraceae bacterium]